MNDPVVQQLQLGLNTHGRALLDRRAELEQLLAGVAASFPGKVKALLILLDKQAVAFLLNWAQDVRPDKGSYEQVRQQIASKFEQANVLNAAAASWAFDAWAAALGLRAPGSTPPGSTPPGSTPPGSTPRASTVAAQTSPAPAAQPVAAAAAARAGAPARNVYAPPSAPVDDPHQDDDDTAEFIEGGRSVGAGRGVTWIAEGWQLFKQYPLIWIVNFVLFMVITVAVQVVPLIGAIAGMLLAPVLGGGLMLGAQAVRRGESLLIEHLFAGFREHTAALVLIGLFYLVGVIVIVFAALLSAGVGVMALLSGGEEALGAGVVLIVLVALALAIPLAMAYWFAPALVVLNDLGAFAAMKASFFACLKNILPFLVYGLVAVVVGVLALIPLGLGWLVLGPVLVASIYTGYRDIFYAQ